MKIGMMLLAATWVPVVAMAQHAVSAVQVARLDSLFARCERPGSPGCALGVASRYSIGPQGARGFVDQLPTNRAGMRSGSAATDG